MRVKVKSRDENEYSQSESRKCGATQAPTSIGFGQRALVLNVFCFTGPYYIYIYIQKGWNVIYEKGDFSELYLLA